MNKVCISGNLVKDIEVKKTQSGNSVVSFTLGVKRNYKTGDEYLTDFIDCVAWNQSAEYLGKYASKGCYIEVAGSIMKRDYENNEGRKVYITEVKADEVKVLNTNRESEPRHANMEPERRVERPQEITFDQDQLPFY